MTRTKRGRALRLASALSASLAGALSAPATARAWDPATTHAGLTERAGHASHLGRVLAESLGRPLGLFETLKLDAAKSRLAAALRLVDASEGYAPSEDGRLPAIGWLVAGSVIEDLPAGRLRNHYFDPTTRRGLDETTLLTGIDRRIVGAAVGESPVRDVFTGGALEGATVPSVAWLTSPDNDQSLAAFLDARERAVTAATPAERDAALAEALLVAGGLVHVIEDAGEPALVRGDFTHEFAEDARPLRRWVAEKMGRLGLPDGKGSPPTVAHLADLISNAAGTGLADRTARRFFSLGTLPDGAQARTAPTVTAGPAQTGYAAGEGVKHLATWRRDGEAHVRWSLDGRCYADYAAAILPEVELAAVAAVDHLFRTDLVVDGDGVKVGSAPLGAGRIALFVDGEGGKRREIAAQQVAATRPGETLAAMPPAEQLGGARRLIAVFRGVDGNGEPLVLSVDKKL